MSHVPSILVLLISNGNILFQMVDNTGNEVYWMQFNAGVKIYLAGF